MRESGDQDLFKNAAWLRLARAPWRSWRRRPEHRLFHNKAKNIQACCQILAERFDGQVPQDLETLVQLPGIGRKTANVVLGTAFGIASGVVVDTHVTRVSQRLALTVQKDPTKIEEDLIQLIPRSQWIDFSHRVIHHGRSLCAARKPKFPACPLETVCPEGGCRVGLGDDRSPSESSRHTRMPSAEAERGTADGIRSMPATLRTAYGVCLLL